MNSNVIRPSRWWPRYQPELCASGEAGIRDRETDALHRAASVGDAHVDADYLNTQYRAGNLSEVARHLAFVAEQASSGRRPTAAPTAPADPRRVLDAAEEWNATRLDAASADQELARTRAFATLRRTLESAGTEAHLADAVVLDGIRGLYAEPRDAQRLLSDTSETLPLKDLAALVRSEPTAFGALAQPSARRFGPAAAEDELANRVERLAAALETQETAHLSLTRAAASAAAELAIDLGTPPDDLARALNQSSREDTTARSRDPRLHLSRATDHLRALLVAADEKTTAALVHRFPEASTIAREARAHSSLAPEL